MLLGWVNFALVVLLHAGDEWMTARGLASGARELNPLARPFMTTPLLSVTTKALGVLVIAFSMAFLLSIKPAAFWGLFALHHGVMIAVLLHNWRILHSLQAPRG